MKFMSSLLFISLLTLIGRPFAAAGAGVLGTRPPAPARALTTQQPADGGWPRAYVTPSGARLVMYEPQIASWLDQKRMARYAAVSSTATDNRSTVKVALGVQHAGTAADAPTVFVSRKPAELMSLNGVAAYMPVMGTHFEWVSNTGSDVFRLGTTDTVYFGTRTRAGAVNGPYEGASYATQYNPRTGTYTRGSVAWGPGGARGARVWA